MPTAYVLINCDLGSEDDIIKELKKLPEVVAWNVRRIDKVRSTLTMMVIEGQGDKDIN